MFTRQKSQDPANPEPKPTISKDEPAAPPAPAAPSLLSSDATITGEVVSAGELLIDGKMNGNVRAFRLMVGENAVVDGDLIGDSITVRGHVNGNIRGVEVKLVNGCNVRGNILHDQLSVESGALFEGRIRRADNPLSEEAARAEKLRDASDGGPKRAIAEKSAAPANAEKKPAPKKAPAKDEKGPVIVKDGAVIVRSS